MPWPSIGADDRLSPHEGSATNIIARVQFLVNALPMVKQ
jgi:hypothetical protein